MRSHAAARDARSIKPVPGPVVRSRAERKDDVGKVSGQRRRRSAGSDERASSFSANVRRERGTKTNPRRLALRGGVSRVAKKAKKSHRSIFPFAKTKPRNHEDSFSRDFSNPVWRVSAARAQSRVSRNAGIHVENAWNVGKSGTALFRAGSVWSFVAPTGGATLRSAARAARVRAGRARAGLLRNTHVPPMSIVANESRSSCVAVSERRACAVFDRRVRRDPEGCFRRALANFCALKCARNARGGACERGGAITVGREATIAADRPRRSYDPAGACAR